MADVKISALTNLGATPANDDELVIVDKDGGGASGTTKKVTVSDLLSGAGSALAITDGASVTENNVSQVTVGTGLELVDDATDGHVTINSTVTDTNTTYDIASAQSTDDVDITLTGSDATTDTIKLVAGSNVTLTDNGSNQVTIAATSSGSTTTINNNADNRVITGSASANTLEGEANLLYDAGVLDVKNAGSQSEVKLYCEDANQHFVSLKAPAHAGFSGDVTYTFPAVYAASSGQVLSSDTSGNLSWASVSANSLGGQVASYEVQASALASGDHEGQIVKIGTDTDLVAGTLYYWSGTSWDVADNNAESTAKGPLGIALGTSSANDGVLTQGVYQPASTPPGSAGSLLYLGGTGALTAAAPVTNGKILRVMGQNLDGTNILFQPSQDFIELGTPTGSITVVGQEVDFATSDTALDTAGEAEGTVVKFGTGTTVPGRVYVYQGTAWAEADATGEATTKGLLGLALGTVPATNGMLTNGMGYLSAAPTGGSDGAVLYVSDTATGTLTATVPADSTDFVRVAGYQVGTQKVYFSPSQDYIDLA